LYCPSPSVKTKSEIHSEIQFKAPEIHCYITKASRDGHTMAFFEYTLRYVKAILDVIALKKPSQLKESSVIEAIETPRHKIDRKFQ
jgi:hypothetical protein